MKVEEYFEHIQEYGLLAKKEVGQNFLINTDACKRIVEAFELQKMDSNGTPITYLLGQMREDSDHVIFEFQDEQGREQTLLDYNVKSGDRLVLVMHTNAG